MYFRLPFRWIVARAAVLLVTVAVSTICGAKAGVNPVGLAGDTLARDSFRWRLWDYRWYVVSILVGQTSVIGWLVFERRGRRLAELESRRHLRAVIHLHRAATAGALSASVVHELKQPLGAILSNAEAAELLLAENPPDVDGLREVLADIRQANQRATEIIGYQARLLKQEGDVDPRESDLNEIVETILRVLKPVAKERGIQLSACRESRRLPVRAERVHLEQVILNLAMNGMDAMEDCPPGKRRLLLKTMLTSDSTVETSVCDSGIGVPDDKLNDIFDTFYTTKRQGTGLGLSIARTIIQTYGGRIWAENRAVGGAVFRFALPLSGVYSG